MVLVNCKCIVQKLCNRPFELFSECAILDLTIPVSECLPVPILIFEDLKRGLCTERVRGTTIYDHVNGIRLSGFHPFR